MPQKALAQIEALVAARVGLDVESIGQRGFEAAVRARMSARGAPDVHAYLAMLEGGTPELGALVDEVVVPETWFFRDREPFLHLQRFARDRVAERTLIPLRVLSVPCSTGEEPYSVAMALLDAGVPVERFRVDAIDVSEGVLARARLGLYGKNSFRGDDLAYRDRHFEPQGHQWQLSERVRQAVRFRRANLLDHGALAEFGHFDVIFFRNLLIYLNADARARAMSTLDSLLAGDGIIYAGHAESLDRVDHRFKVLPSHGAFTFVRRGGRAGEASTSSRRHRSAERRAPKRAPRPPAPHKPLEAPDAVTAKLPPAALRPPPPPADLLGEARVLADRGKLDAAAAACERDLNQRGPTAAAFCLLGTIKRAAGEARAAEDCFQRALYLDPNHYEALVQLALSADQRGDQAAATQLRRRAERAAARASER